MTATEQLSVGIGRDGAFVLSGELDMLSVGEIRDTVGEAVAPGRVIVLDLAHLTFMDSPVIRWLVELSDASGQPVVLRNIRPVLRHALHIVAATGILRGAWVFEDNGPRYS